MRLHALTTRGIGAPFRDREVAIDFDALGPGVVALIGGNGAGKSHLLELSGPGTLHRELPSYRTPTGKRGEALIEHVHPDTRDAFSELTFDQDGVSYRVRVVCDGRRRKTEVYVWRGGEPEPFAGPLPTAVDAILDAIVPSRAFLLAGPFACQGGCDGFFRLGPAERKALFAELLGLGELERLAAAATAREQASVAEVARVRRELAEAETHAARADVLGSELELIDAMVVAATSALDVTRARASEATAERAAAATMLAAAEATAASVRDAYDRHVAERERLAARIATLSDRLAALDATLADVPDGAAAANERAIAEGELAVVTQRADETQAAIAALDVQLAGLAAEIATARGTHATLTRAAADAVTATRAVAEAAHFAAGAAEGTPLVEAARIELDDAENARPSIAATAAAEIAAAQTRAAIESERRAVALQSGLLDRVPGVPECGACPLTASARAARERRVALDAALLDMPDESEAARNALALHDAHLSRLRDRLTRGREYQAHLDRLATIGADTVAQAERLTAVTQELIDLTTRGRALVADQATATAQREALQAEHGRHLASREALRARVADLTALIDRAAQAASARGEQQAMAMAMDEALVEQATLGATTPPTPPDLSELRRVADLGRALADEATRAVDAATAALDSHRTARARIEGERDALGEVATRVAALRAEEAAHVTAAGDWATLRQALGRNGVQALLIDAAGPEVSALANDLLAACYTPRFQIALTTTQPTADGKGVKEVFEPRILDAEAGRDGTRGSGGETALIDAALRLAIVLANTRRAGHRVETLWLDEATAALSAENAPRYVDMIRRAMALGGFHQALLVTHDPHIWESADARLIVEDGTVRVWQPAAREAA